MKINRQRERESKREREINKERERSRKGIEESERQYEGWSVGLKGPRSKRQH